MCGITGFIDFKNKGTREFLEKMTSALQHRGPDGQGILFHQANNVTIGLGHRRLSVIDLSAAANQPMHFDGLHIIFNGEIYNYEEIRNTLIQKGHHFLTHSDTEMILHSWREWGKDCIRQWHGMFTMVIFDERSN